MPDSATPTRWLEKIVEQLCSMEGVAHETGEDGRIALTIAYDGETRELSIAAAETDYRAQKNRFAELRETLTALGIKEGATFVPARPSRKPVSPEMLAARAKRQKEFESWQELWRAIREAERSLDVEYELSQMMSYY